MDQVKSTMKVTLWVFIGIEGPWWSPPVPAIAGRGPRHRAGAAGALALYVMVTLFSLGS